MFADEFEACIESRAAPPGHQDRQIRHPRSPLIAFGISTNIRVRHCRTSRRSALPFGLIGRRPMIPCRRPVWEPLKNRFRFQGQCPPIRTPRRLGAGLNLRQVY